MKALPTFLTLVCISAGFVCYAQQAKPQADPLLARVVALEKRVTLLEKRLDEPPHAAKPPSINLFCKPLTQREIALLESHYDEHDMEHNFTWTTYADGSSKMMERHIDGVSVKWFDKNDNLVYQYVMQSKGQKQ